MESNKDSRSAGSAKLAPVIRIDEQQIRDHLGQVVRGTVEETLNAMLNAEADALCRAGRYERSSERASTRAGHYTRKLQTTAGTVEIPTGTELDVRLQNTLNSGTAQVEDRFEGTTLVDVGVGSRVAIPAGSVMRGVITGVEPATRTNRTARMTLSFDQITVSGRSYPIRGTVMQAIEGEGIKGEAGRTAAGAGVGAIIGGILGGFKGALAGILIGGGGTIAATEGKEVELPQGSVLRVRIDSPVQIQTSR